MEFLILSGRTEELLCTISNDADNVAVLEAIQQEDLNKEHTFRFVIDASHEDAQYVEKGNLIGFLDRDDESFFHLFEIAEIDDTHDEDTQKVAICEHAVLELADEHVDDIRPTNVTAEAAMDSALANTRWEVGIVGDFGLNSTNFYRENPLSCITKIVQKWGGELRYRVIINGNRITNRFVDLLPRRGRDTAARIEYGFNMENIERTESIVEIKTALRGYGKGEESGDGFGRRVTFADVEWSVANGDPVDKPINQPWVGDEEAKDIYGRPNGDGTFRHRFGVYENADIEDPEELLEQTYKALQQAKQPFYNYRLKPIILGDTKYSLGDTLIVIDDELQPPIELRSRVIVHERDLLEEDNDVIEIGQFLPLITDEDDRLEKVIATVNDRSGIWDKVEDPIDGNDFPDIIPDVPTLTAEGLFQTVKLVWTFQNEPYIAAYEVYASKLQGFVPQPENLIFRGKTSGFIHSVDTNQQWYYRVRGVNTHNNASAYSNQASGETQRILSAEVMFGAITTDLLADLAVDAEKLANSSVTSTKIANLAVGTAAIANGAITNAKIGNLAVDTAQIQNSAITNAKIANLSADKINAGTLSAIDIVGVNISGSTIISQNGDDIVTMTAGGVTTTGIDGGGNLATTNVTAGRYFAQSKNGSTYDRTTLSGAGFLKRHYLNENNLNANRPKSEVSISAGGSVYGPSIALTHYDDSVGPWERIGRLRIQYSDGGNPRIATEEGVPLEFFADEADIDMLSEVNFRSATGFGQVMARFAMDREWTIRQRSSGSNTGLALRTETASKEFLIEESDGSAIYRFHTANGARFEKNLTVNGTVKLPHHTGDAGEISGASSSGRQYLQLRGAGSSNSTGGAVYIYGQSDANFANQVRIYTEGTSTAAIFHANKRLQVNGDFSASGTKSALVETESYGERLMYAVESPDNRFMDVVEETLEPGEHWIEMNPMFAETINGYSVFPIVQNGGKVSILERDKDRFKVMVTSDEPVNVACFIYGKRKGYEKEYMEEFNSDQ